MNGLPLSLEEQVAESLDTLGVIYDTDHPFLTPPMQLQPRLHSRQWRPP